jgi:hypothetical protein
LRLTDGIIERNLNAGQDVKTHQPPPDDAPPGGGGGAVGRSFRYNRRRCTPVPRLAHQTLAGDDRG